jgi:hypothetical protein
MIRGVFLATVALLYLLPLAGSAQQIKLDHGRRVEDLWVFPSASDPKAWYYIPQTARLATDENGDPVFSFLRYVINTPGEEDSSKGITQADGGGIVTLMATYDTPDEVVKRADRALKQVTEDDETVLRGPVIFKEGNYLLVSSILKEDGEEGKSVLARGRAPVFEGNEVAFSFDVDPQKSKLLLESFKMDTPDVSIMFEMTFEGLMDAYQADVLINWDEVEKNETFGGGVTVVQYLSADLEKGFEELRKSQAIVIKTRGANEFAEAMLDKALTKLLDLMFKKVPPQQAAPKSEGDMLESLVGAIGGLGSLAGGGLGGFANQAATGDARSGAAYFGASVSYEKKELKKSGKTVMSLNSEAPADRYTTMVANIGDLYARYAEDGNRFKTVNLSDAAYQQREVHVGIDGAILPEFAKYINSVTVTLRKKHENGAETVQEIVVDQNTFTKESRDFRMIYGWNGDADRNKWLEYEYRTRWSFKGGGLLEGDWVTTDTNMIDLFAPYQRTTIELIGDAESLKEQGIRGVSVQLDYDFFEGRRSQELALRTKDEIDGKQMEITLPLNTYEYDYKVTWIRRGKPPIVSQGRDDSGVVFVDELPAEEPEAAEAAGT